MGALSTAALSEAISFLYVQTGKLLDDRKDRRMRASAGLDPSPNPEISLHRLPHPFRPTEPARPDLAIVDDSAREIKLLRSHLKPYAEQDVAINADSQGLLSTVDGLRQILERVYGRDISFKDEARSRYAINIQTGGIQATRVKGGYVAGRDIKPKK